MMEKDSNEIVSETYDKMQFYRRMYERNESDIRKKIDLVKVEAV